MTHIENSIEYAMQKIRESQNIVAILFDLDGVLINSFYFWFHLFNATLRHFDHAPISLKTFKQQWGKSTEEDVRKFMPERTVKQVKSFFYSRMHCYARYLKINPQAGRVLKILSKNYKLACVSNSHTKIMHWQMRMSRLNKYFEVVISADDVKRPKPAPDMLLKACRKLKVSPAQSVYIGDTKTDIRAGKSAGCQVIGYRIGNKHRVNKLQGLLKYVKRIKIKEQE